MLTELHIKNIAVIREASIRLGQGLNVFTGETGAGKTMLISAINMVLGERTSREIIRTGEEKASAAALFEDISPAARRALQELGIEDEDGTVLVFREITTSGKNSCKINGMPATVSMLRQLGSALIQLHGQRDSQQLLDEQSQLALLDNYAQTAGQIAAYRAGYNAWRETAARLQRMQMDESQKAQRMDMLQFQLDEIEAAGLEDSNEEADLQARRKMIQASERILQSLTAAYALLRGDDDQLGLEAAMDDLHMQIAGVAQFMDDFSAPAARLQEQIYELAELAGEVRDTLDRFDYNQQELDAIEARLDLIYKLKRKYGAGIDEIVRFGQAARAELEELENADQQIEQLTAQADRLEAEATAAAQELSARRQQAAGEMVQRVQEELAFLDMPGVKLAFACRAQPLSQSGMDKMELLIATNIGEEPKPLNRIASGGELSRIMLAIKNGMAGRDDATTLVFDEIDAGISGRAAGKVGAKLAQVAGGQQVVCVTHLAPVAAFADTHLQIAKQVQEGRAVTQVTMLDEAGTVQELARIGSGELITPAALESARELRALSRGRARELRG